MSTTQNRIRMRGVQICHDPFSRCTTYRRTISVRVCAYCGQPGKYQYRTEMDDSTYTHVDWDPRVFCGISCWRMFYGE